MNKDIVPELLEKIENDFKKRINSNKKINKIFKLIEQNKADYSDVNDLSLEVGEELAKVFKVHITADVLPDGKMYYNIADRLLNATLKNNHNIVSVVASQVQSDMNNIAGMGIKGITPSVNQSRIDGIVRKIAKEDDYTKVAWLLDEPIINFTQSVVDDTIEHNTKFHYKAGLKPKIVRKVVGDCCDWCRAVAGEYKYPDVPKDVYRRHRYCRCTVEYDPGDGKKQDVWKGKDSKYAGLKKKEIQKLERAESNLRKKSEEAKIKTRKLNSFSKKLNVGKQKNHIKGTNEFKQRIKNNIAPSHFENTLEEVKEFGLELIGTGQIFVISNGILKEIVGTHPKLNAYVVNNINGVKLKTNRNVIRYHKDKGWHMYPDYPKKE